jgi:pyridoxamine 5'-phosphate oxidase
VAAYRRRARGARAASASPGDRRRGGEAIDSIVLLKQASPAIVFAFSAGSRKGRELAANPRAAGTLYWRETLQQVVFEGPVERMGAEESDRLFAERPPAGRATTVASNQGETLEDPERLRGEAAALAGEDEALRRPEDWGGYRLDPDLVEFWHGSPDRLHRRLLYVKRDSGWSHQRLQP